MLSLVVLAGGESRRMGRNKALIPLAGKPLIQWVVDRLGPLADETLVLANEPAPYSFLSLPVIADTVRGMGALGGLYSALCSASNQWVAIVACDMPFVSPTLLQYELELADSDAFDVILPLSRGGAEPFHALYRREGCLPLICEALGRGERRVGSWMEHAKVQEIDDSTVARLDSRGLCFLNVNTPEELTLAELEASRLVSPIKMGQANKVVG